jgi:hypothetical protein
VGGSKRLVEILQMLSVRWKIDRATISVYHTYSLTSHAPVMGESHLEDYNATIPSDTLCKGEIIISSCMLQFLSELVTVGLLMHFVMSL